MDFNVFREFIVLSQTMNYSKAAQILHVAQPTLSKHINALEKELNCELLTRDKRHVELTQAGSLFAAAAMQMVDTYDDVRTRIEEVQMTDPVRVSGIFTDSNITSIISLATMLLDEEGFKPVQYDPSPSGNFVEQVLADEIDIAIASADVDSFDAVGLDYIPLSRSRFVAMINPNSTLAGLDRISLDDLRTYRFVKYADSYTLCGWVNIESVCKEHGFSPRVRTMLGHNYLNYSSVSLGIDDVVILPADIPQLRYLKDLGKATIIPVTDEDAAFRLFAIYKKDNLQKIKPVIDAYTRARKTILNHGKNATLVESNPF